MKYTSYQKYLDFIDRYKVVQNASTGSEVDANANVESKNITTLSGELFKKDYIGINRLLMYKKISEMYSPGLADEYIRQLESHEIYKHDETSIMPYTYGAQEVVNVVYKGRKFLVPMKRLYDLCDEPEAQVDAQQVVYAKYPIDMSIEDKEGYTAVKRLVRKERRRDLIRVKTSFNNDIIVTDNHPMIVCDDIDKTVEAVDSTGSRQYRCESKMEFGGVENIDIHQVAGDMIALELSDGCVVQVRAGTEHFSCPKTIRLDRELGYLVGFFIGDGNFNAEHCAFTQKDSAVLEKIANIAYTHFSAPSQLYHDYDGSKFVLLITHPALHNLLRKTFGIGHMAQNKTLPENIYEYNREFAIGIIEGLIDSDGTVTGNGSYQIRLSSRSAILQIASVVNALGASTTLTVQQSQFGCNDRIQQKYQLFGVMFRDPGENILFNGSVKSVKARKISKWIKSNQCGWINIDNVSVMDNKPFLDLNEFIYDITTESRSFVCNGFWVHNCTSITMYPFLCDGLKPIGGLTEAPKHLDSFCGAFINLVFAIAAQFAGAVSTPEFLTYFDYFARKEYGSDYYLSPDKIVTQGVRPKTIKDILQDKFGQVVYSLNQPAAARNFQSVFWNIAYFDKNYFNGLFDHFVFPDSTPPCWDSVNWLQKTFMKWFNAERLKQPLTFPVESLSLLDNGKDYVDSEWKDFAAEMYAEGHSFFTYRSDSVDSLSSCCRLRNEMSDNTFSYTLGAGGVSTGSKAVITININRLVQNAVRAGRDIAEAVGEQVIKVQKYLLAFNDLMHDNFKAKLLPIYDAGFISLDKQYLTIGINGFVEGAEFLGIDINPNEAYFEYGEKILKPIYTLNKAARTATTMFNTECVPAENLGIKNAKWDKKDGYVVPRDCYNSYFYIVEDETTSLIDKFILHGSKLTKYLDGGSALHGNLQEHLSKEQYLSLLDVAIKTGCSYFTFNIPNTICNDCGHISKHKLASCPKCGSAHIDYMTRIIGYLKRISAFSADRQREAGKRYYE